jgi:hypothetical protein
MFSRNHITVANNTEYWQDAGHDSGNFSDTQYDSGEEEGVYELGDQIEMPTNFALE